jgi:hypothetical protein
MPYTIKALKASHKGRDGLSKSTLLLVDDTILPEGRMMTFVNSIIAKINDEGLAMWSAGRQ